MTPSRCGPALLALFLCVLNSPLWSEPPATKKTDRYGDALPSGAVARLGSVRLLHDHPPGLMVFAGDNKTLTVLTGHRGGNVLWVWNVATGALIRRVPVGKAQLSAGAYSADGRVLALLAGDEFGLVDVTTGRFVRRIDVPSQRITWLALSPDGKLLAAGCAANRLSETSEVILWETANGKELARFKEHKTAVETVAFSRDGRRLFSSSNERKGIAGTRFPDTIPAAACIWDIKNSKLHRRFRPNGVNAVFAPDGKSMACSGEKGTIHLWDLERGRERAALEGEWRSYLFTPDSKALITGGVNRMLGVVDVATGKIVQMFFGHVGKGVSPVALSPDGKLLATVGSSDNRDTAVRFWDVAAGVERHPFAAHQDDLTCLAFAPDGKTLISASKDTTLRVWDAATGEPKRVYDQHRAAITVAAFAPDGKSVASGDADNAVHLWEPANGKPLHRFAVVRRDEQTLRSGIRCLVFAADGKTLFAGSWSVKQQPGAGFKVSGRLAAWDVATGRSRRPDKEEEQYPAALTVDGRYLASGALDFTNFFLPRETLFLRRRESSKVLGRIDGGEEGTFPEVIFSHDGRLVAAHVRESNGDLSFGRGSKVRGYLWETATGKRIASLEQTGQQLAFSPDGKFVAVADPISGDLCLLSTVTGRVSAKMSGHPGGITCCAFSSDGSRLATGGVDRTILIWDVSGFKHDRTLGRIEATRKNAEKRWEELSDGDPARAYRAVASLTAMPEHSLPLLREHLKPAAGIPAATLEQAIQDLDSAEFAVRERANATLEKANELARLALLQALKAKPSLELRRRAESLLERIDAAPLPADRLRLLRALVVLERIGTAEARQFVKRLADGAAGALLTEEAKATLERLNRRK